MTVYAEICNPLPEFSYWGVIILYINGKQYSSTTMVSSGYSYIQKGHLALGKCSIELPQYGKVKVVLKVIIDPGNLAGHYLGGRNITLFTY